MQPLTWANLTLGGALINFKLHATRQPNANGKTQPDGNIGRAQRTPLRRNHFGAVQDPLRYAEPLVNPKP